jgi:hypothetical protein
MRKFLTAATFAIAAFASQAQADEPTRTDVATDVSGTLAEAEDSTESYGYNIWFCSAIKRGPVGYNAHFYFGASEPFAQGSGQGQQARYYALQQALHSCGGDYVCVADCYVSRFQL